MSEACRAQAPAHQKKSGFEKVGQRLCIFVVVRRIRRVAVPNIGWIRSESEWGTLHVDSHNSGKLQV